MGAGNAWCHLTFICKPRVIFAFHAQRRLSDVNKPWSMRAVHNRHGQSNVQSTIYVGSPRPTSADWGVNVKGDTRMPSPTNIEQCKQSTNDDRPMPLAIGGCRFPEEDIPCLMLPAFNGRWCRPSDLHILRHIILAVGQCRLPEMHQPLLMLFNVGWCEGHSFYVYMQQQLHAGLADATFH